MTAWLAEQVSELGPQLRRTALAASSTSAAACVPIYFRSQIFVPPLLLFRRGADRSEQLPHLLVPQLLLHEVEYLDAAAAARVERELVLVVVQLLLRVTATPPPPTSGWCVVAPLRRAVLAVAALLAIAAPAVIVLEQRSISTVAVRRPVMSLWSRRGSEPWCRGHIPGSGY